MPQPEILNVPPREAVERFRSKGFETTFSWQDADAALHRRSFTVAKAMEQDILADIRTAVDRAIADGETFEAFAEELEPLLVRRGWWGRQPMLDPLTGETRIVQLGSRHRLRTIFDTNLRTSYGAGRWDRIEELKDRMPYLRYVAVLDDRTREEHRAWHGIVLPADHPFWNTHYPPNGWRCRCITQQLGEDDLERYGYKVTEPLREREQDQGMGQQADRRGPAGSRGHRPRLGPQRGNRPPGHRRGGLIGNGPLHRRPGGPPRASGRRGDIPDRSWLR